MKLIIYTRFLNLTSVLLNECVKYKLWIAAKYLINFRKKHIARTMRGELVSSPI
jgi:hypothetical protein